VIGYYGSQLRPWAGVLFTPRDSHLRTIVFLDGQNIYFLAKTAWAPHPPQTATPHGPEAEVDEHLLWQDFFAILNPKERQVVVCLRSGVTKAAEIAKLLGYANHSPVSKSLRRIRQKVQLFLDN